MNVVTDMFLFIRRAFSVALGITVLWFSFSMMTSPVIPFRHWDVFKTPAYTRTSAGRPVHWADYPKLVDLQTRTFDQLLNGSVGIQGSALEVMKAEMASDDLITLVRHSDLENRDRIADRLSRFVDDAKGTGKSLRSLRAKIHGAVDS